MSALFPATGPELSALLERLEDPAERERMISCQREGVSARSAERIGALIHRMVDGGEEEM